MWWAAQEVSYKHWRKAHLLRGETLLMKAHLLRGVLPGRQAREGQREPRRKQGGEDGVGPGDQHPRERQQQQQEGQRRLRPPRLPVHQDRREGPRRHEQEEEHRAYLWLVRGGGEAGGGSQPALEQPRKPGR